jgi:hypothetical protein
MRDYRRKIIKLLAVVFVCGVVLASLLSWPILLVIVFALGISVAVGYAVTVLTLWAKLMSKRSIGIGTLKMYIPFFWASLFRELEEDNQK